MIPAGITSLPFDDIMVGDVCRVSYYGKSNGIDGIEIGISLVTRAEDDEIMLDDLVAVGSSDIVTQNWSADEACTVIEEVLFNTKTLAIEKLQTIYPELFL